MEKGEDRIMCAEGDIVCLPGGGETHISARGEDCVLYSVTDEPALAWNAPAPGASRSACIISSHLHAVHQRETDEKLTGKFVLLSGPGAETTNTITRTISLAMNSLEAGGSVPNAVALTLCLEGENVYSMVDGERSDWHKFAVIITPPTALHSPNEGNKQISAWCKMVDCSTTPGPLDSAS